MRKHTVMQKSNPPILLNPSKKEIFALLVYIIDYEADAYKLIQHKCNVTLLCFKRKFINYLHDIKSNVTQYYASRENILISLMIY